MSAKLRPFSFYRDSFGHLAVKPLHLDLHFSVWPTRVVVKNNTSFLFQGDRAKSVELKCADDIKVLSVGRFKTHSRLGQSNRISSHVKSFADLQSLKFEHKDNTLTVHTGDEEIRFGEEFVLQTITEIVPSDNILEGVYNDYTTPTDSGPKNPPTLITQCQQYGFERIVPCIDRMVAKAYYTTTIVADERYSRSISNGDLAPGFFTPETGLPIYQPSTYSDFASTGAGKAQSDEEKAITRQTVVYHNRKVRMAPYLFFFGVGTWRTFARKLIYPNGDSVLLEMVVFGNLAKPDMVEIALNAMHDSVMWVHLSTGPERYEHEKERKQIYALLKDRDTLLAKTQGPLITTPYEGKAEAVAEPDAAIVAKLKNIEAELKKLIAVWNVTGHTYKGAIYREIAMENSDYGGMENVGNTTILSSRMYPTPWLSDRSYIYMEAVKVHEFYHDINGSQVTGYSPFEIWLNEAVTVHIERERTAALFGVDATRLGHIRYAFHPSAGPLVQDASKSSLAIEPEGFNRTQELITAMTYFKAPELVRMFELIMTKPVFAKGLYLYYERFRYGNATTFDWIHCMEEAADRDLMPFAEAWLSRIGYPIVSYSTEYDDAAKMYRVTMSQEPCVVPDGVDAKEQTPWHIPIDYGVVKDGKVLAEGLYMFTEKNAVLEIPVNAAPDFLSFARAFSFFGKSVNLNASDATLAKQAMTDSDAVNRFLAYRKLADDERYRLIAAFDAKDNVDALTVSPTYVNLHAKILFDESIEYGSRAAMLGEADELNDPSRGTLNTCYSEMSQSRAALYQAVWDAHSDKVLALLEKLTTESKSHVLPKDGIQARALKFHLLTLVAVGVDSSEFSLASRTASNKVTLDFVNNAATGLLGSSYMSDKMFGLTLLLQHLPQLTDKQALLKKVNSDWGVHPDGLEAFISTVAMADTPDAITFIQSHLLSMEQLNLNLAGHARSLCRGWSMTRKRALTSDAGLKLCVELLVTVGKVNQMSAMSILNLFKMDVATVKPEAKAKYIETLKAMQGKLDPVKESSLCHTITTLLTGFE